MTTLVIDLTVSQPASTTRIGELERSIADQVDANQALEERTVKEAVTASVQYAMRAPLRARFKDLPTSDMKEILLQHMLEENYDSARGSIG
ncbi:hypothetical protein Tco_1228711 [Tanacetum coccineum]|uniref:Uncharacterized protein n=1 Tax=Tanacetum coccineum TaxID=301880 RepID=A0ABQ5B2J3_9ASTR